MKKKYLSLNPLINYHETKRPLEFEELFGNANPVCIEIGIGNGEYLAKMGFKNPDTNYIGIDTEWQSVYRALRRVEQNQLKNIRIIKANARVIFDHLFKAKSIESVYTLFPCPWPKEKSIKHRLFTNAFLKKVNASLKCSGFFKMLTDSKDFFDWVRNEAKSAGYATSYSELNPRAQTKYARKWINEGTTTFFELILSKSEHVPVLSEEEPHMKTYELEHFSYNKFNPTNYIDDISVIVKETLYDASKQTIMLRVLVSEDTYIQHLWIVIIFDNGKWRIRPAKGCAVIPTAGIQKALDHIYGEMLKAEGLATNHSHTYSGRP